MSELEDRTVGITEAEQNKEKGIKRNEDSLRDLLNNTKCPNIQIIGLPEGDKNTEYEKIVEESIVENFPKMEKERAIQV